MKIFFYCIKSFVIFSLISTMGYTQTDLDKLSWIIDKWISTDGQSTSYEHWQKVNDSSYAGASETVKNGDTVFSEKLEIVKEGDDIFYIADVKHNPAPVKFRLTFISENEAVFENPGHDFPQKIIYRHKEGNLHASIEGPGKNGGWRKTDFFMNRMR
jgi:hypothetical protein